MILLNVRKSGDAVSRYRLEWYKSRSKHASIKQKLVKRSLSF